MPTMGNLPLNLEAGGEGHPFPAQGKEYGSYSQMISYHNQITASVLSYTYFPSLKKGGR